jgi:hypothetical protein
MGGGSMPRDPFDGGLGAEVDPCSKRALIAKDATRQGVGWGRATPNLLIETTALTSGRRASCPSSDDRPT